MLARDWLACLHLSLFVVVGLQGLYVLAHWRKIEEKSWAWLLASSPEHRREGDSGHRFRSEDTRGERRMTRTHFDGFKLRLQHRRRLGKSGHRRCPCAKSPLPPHGIERHRHLRVQRCWDGRYDLGARVVVVPSQVDGSFVSWLWQVANCLLCRRQTN
jgi:hypothetical protein